MTFVIQDKTVHEAFDMLERNVGPSAAARAMRERREDERRAAKARVFIKATGNVTERESQALLSVEYQQACEAYYEAVEADERYRTQRSKCESIIECWRTCQSNFRAMAKVA